MPSPEYSQLPAALQPLLVRFYRTHNSRNRVRHEAMCWVARRGDIVAGLCLTPIAQGHFLTGLLVAPAERNQGIGAQLVREALASTQGTVWLFCKPELLDFYGRLGFSTTDNLPEMLRDRLMRYRRNKTLIALFNDRGMQMQGPTLTISIACLFDESGRMLIVRKRGTRFFMLPGGKAEVGETALETLIRELNEELGLTMGDRDFKALGHFQAPAANEPGHHVKADVFMARLPHTVSVQAELEELGWLELAPCTREDVAPLLRGQVIPALLASAAAGGDPGCDFASMVGDQGEMGSLAGKVSSIASSS
ncbi:GNAT family N-acetyltransferase [Pseudomonas sp. GD03855]|nr:GNAT family N-acetyltransferase [Pseudomonas sp. GD03856]MDH2265793.1 GNAT family N-acetyltransferase [Pseudomonas sp. GD03855]